MVFSSAAFLFVFLPIVFVLYFIPLFRNNSREIKKKNLVLCLASLVFYAWGEPIYVILMLLSIFFNFNIGLDIEKNFDNKKKSRRILIAAIIFNIFILGFFKYYGFIIDNINSIFSLDIKYVPLALPVGVSFYTFQILSYVIDVYKGQVKVQKSLIAFTAYITMFPQLIAGPIVQYSDIEMQLQKRKISLNKFAAGVLMFIRGLGKKVIFANTIGAIYTEISEFEPSSLGVVTAWLGIICYTMQIYFDFSGYSDMAVGLGKMMGFRFVSNFNFPYTAVSIKDFWKRWHISLSAWFRDYVYIPLGGNRKGTLRTIFNIAAVWTLTGLWHGAAWSFVMWGAFYGVLLIAEKYLFSKIMEKIPRFIRHITTMLIVMTGWVFFSSPSLSSAFTYLGSMFGLNSNGLTDGNTIYYLATSAFPLILMSLSAFGIYRKMYKLKNYTARMSVMWIWYMLIFALCIVYLVSETYNPFLYFRF